jgi:predicted ATPase
MKQIITTVFAIISFAALASDVRHVDVRDVALDPATFMGSTISIHGCLVFNIHGTFVWPCGSSDWHELILIEDPTHELAPRAFEQLGLDYSKQVEADFRGVVVQRHVDLPTPGSRYFVVLESIADPAPLEP